MSTYSQLTKIKHKFIEIFDKEAKTKDAPEFNDKLKQILESKVKIEKYSNNVKIFIEASSAQINLHNKLAESMFKIYNASVYESQILQLMTELSKMKGTIDRFQKIKDNLLKNAGSCIGQIKQLSETMEKRENERVYYDHYRVKISKMEQPGKESTSTNPDDQQKYARNQSKFDQTKLKFELLSTQVNNDIQKIEAKIEKVSVDLTFKFSKEIQLSIYRDMNQVFYRLRHIESEMVDKAHEELTKQKQREQREIEDRRRVEQMANDQFGGTLNKYGDSKYLAKASYGQYSSSSAAASSDAPQNNPRPPAVAVQEQAQPSPSYGAGAAGVSSPAPRQGSQYSGAAGAQQNAPLSRAASQNYSQGSPQKAQNQDQYGASQNAQNDYNYAQNQDQYADDQQQYARNNYDGQNYDNQNYDQGYDNNQQNYNQGYDQNGYDVSGGQYDNQQQYAGDQNYNYDANGNNYQQDGQYAGNQDQYQEGYQEGYGQGYDQDAYNQGQNQQNNGQNQQNQNQYY